MKKIGYNILPIGLLCIFLHAYLVKVEHHHDHASFEFHFFDTVEEDHDDCPVCQFEFSIFSSQKPDLSFEIVDIYCTIFPIFYSEVYFNTTCCTSRLRAPPFSLLNIIKPLG